MRRPKVDLNVSEMDFISPILSPDAQLVHNFMPMMPFMLPDQQETQEDEEEQAKNFAIMKKQCVLVRSFWEKQKDEIGKTIIVYKNDHPLPLARIKKAMKSNENVKMLSAEAPVVFARACELFIMELTLRAWLQTEDGKRRTLQRCDIARALRLDELFDFLVDFVTCDCQQDDDESEKPFEEVEIHPAKRLHSSGIDINEGFMIPNRKQQIMVKPSVFMAEFDYGSTSKMRKNISDGRLWGRKIC